MLIGLQEIPDALMSDWKITMDTVNVHEESHRRRQCLVDGATNLAPRCARFWFGSDDVTEHIGHDRAHDIVQSDVSNLAPHVSALILRDTCDRESGPRTRERLLARLDVLHAEHLGTRELSMRCADSRLIRGDHFDAPEREQNETDHAKTLIRAPEEGRHALYEIRHPEQQS